MGKIVTNYFVGDSHRLCEVKKFILFCEIKIHPTAQVIKVVVPCNHTVIEITLTPLGNTGSLDYW